jgi:hypothetical protein
MSSIKTTNIKYKVGDKELDVDFHIGNPAKGAHPIGFQKSIIKENYGGELPKDANDLMEYVKKVSDLYHLPFVDVFDYLQIEAKSLLRKKKNIKKEIDLVGKLINLNDK